MSPSLLLCVCHSVCVGGGGRGQEARGGGGADGGGALSRGDGGEAGQRVGAGLYIRPACALRQTRGTSAALVRSSLGRSRGEAGESHRTGQPLPADCGQCCVHSTAQGGDVASVCRCERDHRPEAQSGRSNRSAHTNSEANALAREVASCHSQLFSEQAGVQQWQQACEYRQ